MKWRRAGYMELRRRHHSNPHLPVPIGRCYHVIIAQNAVMTLREFACCVCELSMTNTRACAGNLGTETKTFNVPIVKLVICTAKDASIICIFVRLGIPSDILRDILSKWREGGRSCCINPNPVLRQSQLPWSQRRLFLPTHPPPNPQRRTYIYTKTNTPLYKRNNLQGRGSI